MQQLRKTNGSFAGGTGKQDLASAKEIIIKQKVIQKK